MEAMRKGFVTLAILTAVAVGGTVGSENAWAHRGGDRNRGCAGEARHGGWEGYGHPGLRLAKALDLSSKQTEQVKAIFLKHREGIAPLRKEMAAEWREMRKLIQSDKPDEAAIREQARKIAATGGDLAVRRAMMAKEVRAVLTPEQIVKFRALQEKRDRRIDRMGDRGKEGQPKGE